MIAAAALDNVDLGLGPAQGDHSGGTKIGGDVAVRFCLEAGDQV